MKTRMLKIKILGQVWAIFEEPSYVVQDRYKALCTEQNIPWDENSYILGFTDKTRREIYLNGQPCLEEKRKTLKHELTHCFLWVTGGNYNEYSEEAVCDIVAACSEFIEDTIEFYFDIDGDGYYDAIEECEEKFEPFCAEECIMDIESEVVA